MKKLQDKVAIITGSRRGIGKGIAIAFAKEGCKVVISDYVEDKDGKKNVAIGSDATIVRSPGNADIDIDSVRIDDYIIAMGYSKGDDELEGKRVIVSEKPFAPPEKLAGIGKVSSIDKYAFMITPRDGGDDIELFFTKSTSYKSSEGSLDFKDISPGDEVLFTAVRDQDNDWSATIVMRIKQN